MPSASCRLEINDEALDAIDRELAHLAKIGTGRARAVRRGLTDAGKIVETRVRETLPLPGYPGDNPDLVPLRNTLATKFIDYGNGVFVVVVGYDYTRGGAHGHAVEAGHRIAKGGTLRHPGRKTPPMSKVTKERGKGTVGGFVSGRWDIRNAVQATEEAQSEAVLNGVREFIAEGLA